MSDSFVLSALPSQGLGLLILLLFAMAPVPLVLHLLSPAKGDARPGYPLTHGLLAAVALWSLLEAGLVCLLGWAGRLGLIHMIIGAAALLGWGGWLLTRDRDRAAGPRWLLEKLSPAEWSVVVVVASLGLVLAMQLVMFPVTEIDSLNYQLPRVDQWYQAGHFYDPLRQFDGNLINNYPFAWNTLFLMAVMAMGHDQFALLFNLVAWLAAGLAVYGLARLCGGHRTACLVAAALMMLMPVNVSLLRTARIDLAFGAFFLAGVYFVFHAHLRRDIVSAALALACGAMTLGTKMSGVPYAAALGGLWVWLLASRRLGRLSGRAPDRPPLNRRSLLLLVVVAVAGLLVGPSWYVHNAIMTGNPLGSVKVTVFGMVLWNGEVTPASIGRTTLLRTFDPGDGAHWSMAWSATVAQLGLPGLLLAAGALALPLKLWRGSRERFSLVTVVVLALACLYLYVSTPWTANIGHGDYVLTPFMGQAVRYAVPFLGLLAAVSGAIWPGQPSAAFAWLFSVACIAGAFIRADPWGRVTSAGHWQAVLAMVAMVLGFVAWRSRVRDSWTGPAARRARARVGLSAAVALLLTGGMVTASLAALRFRHEVRDRMFGGITRFVDRLPPTTRLGFWGTHSTHFVYGTHLRRPLDYVPLDRAHSAPQLVDLLRAKGLDLIAVGPRLPESATSPAWSLLAEESATFERVQGENVTTDVLVYRLR